MTTKRLARQWFEEVWNCRNPTVMSDLMHNAAVGVSEGGVIHGPAEFRSLVYEPMVAAFPDIRVTVVVSLAKTMWWPCDGR